MTENDHLYEGTFHHLVLKGSAYEVGQQQASFIKGTSLAGNYISGEPVPSYNSFGVPFKTLQKQAEICFGSPGFNPWHTFNLVSDTGTSEYRIKFTQHA